MKVKRKNPGNSKKNNKKSKESYEKRLSLSFTIAVLVIVLLAIGIYYLSKQKPAETYSKIAALVNGEKITTNELNIWYKISVSPNYMDKITKRDFLEKNLIPQKLLMQEVVKKDIKLGKDDVETAFGKFLIDTGISLEEFKKQLAKDNVDIIYVKEAFRQRLLITKFLEDNIFSNIDISNETVEIIYNQSDLSEKDIGINEVRTQIINQLKDESETKALQDYIRLLDNNAKIEIFYGTENKETSELKEYEIKSFTDNKEKICKEDNKPVIRFFGTSSCKHCIWISKTFDDVMERYSENIIAYHWNLDTGDDTLTEEKENGIPKSEIEIFKKYNPEGTVPTYVFGCKYIRIGNFFEKENNLAQEEREFTAVIEKLLP